MNAINKTVQIMPCLDMQNGRVVKGIHFVDIADAGDPVLCAEAYCSAGADQLAMLDITATIEKRATLLDVVRSVAKVATIPFTVGGGISDMKSAEEVLAAGADKISVSSAAYRNRNLLKQLVTEFGGDKITAAIDVDANPDMPSGYEVYIDGGRTATGTDAVEWAKFVDDTGVGVILPTSKAGDGAKTGYELPLLRALSSFCQSELVASGGAGTMEHFLEAAQAGATILLAASVFHFHLIDISALKAYLKSNGISVNL